MRRPRPWPRAGVTAGAILQTVNGLAIPEASGVVAALSVLNTGTGFSYYPNVHLGASSWYLLAAAAANPYRSTPSFA